MQAFKLKNKNRVGFLLQIDLNFFYIVYFSVFLSSSSSSSSSLIQLSYLIIKCEPQYIDIA
jgi:hypothetical protein